MATNFEYHKDEIINFISHNWAIGKQHGELVKCSDIECRRCDFMLDSSECENCREARTRYFNEEHIEPPKLTKRERAFCEIVASGVIARDENGELNLFSDAEIHKEDGKWIKESKYCNNIQLYVDEFDFVRWEDEKPWAVEDLLKLEVMEDA